MTNFEKYKDKIMKIVTENHCNPAKKNGVIVACEGLKCKECDFGDMGNCDEKRFNWLCEDDGEEPDGCDGCKYEYKREDESPCTECCNNYMSKWKRKPKKTRQSEFLKLFPNARLIDGVLDIMPCKIVGREFQEQNCNTYCYCETCRKEYWLKEVE